MPAQRTKTAQRALPRTCSSLAMTAGKAHLGWFVRTVLTSAVRFVTPAKRVRTRVPRFGGAAVRRKAFARNLRMRRDRQRKTHDAFDAFYVAALVRSRE